ncbi:MAG: LamG domain-containing protein [Candidatus Nealsonbacteria bacterium]|nr:LamG domain-containing protein [Candidatus Nealsonbacteria bacterium]
MFNWHGPLGLTGMTVKDVGGRGADGTLSGMDAGADWVQTQHGHALEFDGSSQCVDNITLGSALDGRPISCWTLCRFDDLDSSYPRIIDRVYNGQFAFYLRALGVGMAANCSGGTIDTFVGPPLAANTWHSIVWTYDGTTIKIYVNGVLHGTQAQSKGLLAASSAATRIGNRVDGTNRGWDGLIAAVALWNRVLLPSESRLLHTDPHAIVRPMRRTGLSTPRVAGPYRTLIAETFHTGAAAGEPFVTGAAIGESFNTGPTAGQIDGRCG